MPSVQAPMHVVGQAVLFGRDCHRPREVEHHHVVNTPLDDYEPHVKRLLPKTRTTRPLTMVVQGPRRDPSRV